MSPGPPLGSAVTEGWGPWLHGTALPQHLGLSPVSAAHKGCMKGGHQGSAAKEPVTRRPSRAAKHAVPRGAQGGLNDTAC